MTNRFGVVLHSESVRWAAAEGVSEDVISAVLLLHETSVDEIVPKLTASELEQVIKLVGRSPRLYPPGTLDALEQRYDKGLTNAAAEGAHCQALAQAAGSTETNWHAYLSTTGPGGAAGVNARDRIGKGPWQNAKGVVVAKSVEDQLQHGRLLERLQKAADG